MVKCIHITNGEIFNQWIENQLNETCIPFNEAMMSYSIHGQLFSEDFMKYRAKCHGVSFEVYREKIKSFLNACDHTNEIDEFVLWFGKDAFCQMNLLTILCILEEKNYTGQVKTVIFDENKDWKEVLHLKRTPRDIKGSKALFQSVLIEHQLMVCDDEIMNDGIKLYLDFLSDTGKLTEIIENHPEMNEIDLIVLLLKESERYGLSDVQAKELIHKVRETR